MPPAPAVPDTRCGSSCTSRGGSPVDPATRRRRLRRLGGAALLAVGRITLWSAAGVRTQRRVAVCSAAGVLVALGIRVEVVNPAVPWPRTRIGHLVASDATSWLDHLALVIALRATPVAEAGVARLPFVGGLARRLGVVFVDGGDPASVAAGAAEATARLRRGENVSGGPALARAAVDAGAVVCPVAVRYRLDGGPRIPSPVDDDRARGLARVLSARRLVVEVHLLPALAATGVDHALLAHRAGSALASVPRPGSPDTHPRPHRRADPRRFEGLSCPCVTTDTTARRSPQRSFTARSPALGKRATSAP